MRLNTTLALLSVSLLLSVTSGSAVAADDPVKEIAAASVAAPLQLTEAQFDIMHKMVDDIHHDLGHIDREMNRQETVATYAPWFTDWGYGWYPPLYDSYPGIVLGPYIGQATAKGQMLPPRKDLLQKWMTSLSGSIQSLSQQVDSVKLPADTPDDITVQMKVLHDIVPTLQTDYTKLSSLLNVSKDYDRQAVAVQTERIKDDVSGIDLLRKRMHRLLKDDK
jgi:hypothetical protein